MFTIALIISAEQSNQFGSHYWRIFEHLGWLHFHETKNMSKIYRLETHAHKKWGRACTLLSYLILSWPGFLGHDLGHTMFANEKFWGQHDDRGQQRYTLLVFSPIHSNYIWYTDCCKLFMRRVMQTEQNLGKMCLMFSDCIEWYIRLKWYNHIYFFWMNTS